MDKVKLTLSAVAFLMAYAGVYYWVSRLQQDRQDFMNECQMDGMKHYYCVSLWNGGGIPVFRSRDMLPLDVN